MPAAAQHAPEASLIGLLNVMLRRRWMIVGPALLLFAAVVASTLLAPRTYTATAAFVPQTRSAAGAIEGLASQLGLSAGGGDPMQSPQFYVELVESRAILRGVAEARYEFASDTGAVSGTLAEIYEPTGATPELRRAELLRILGDQVGAGESQQTGVVRMTVTTSHAELSSLIAANVLERVNDFNLRTRQSQVRAEREFIERRLDEARSDLRAAEGRLQSFLQRNREFGMSSSLSVERDRLERDVAAYRAIYTDLSQNFERARMEEVRDTPVITVLERPEAPARPDPRNLLRNGILALVAGGALGLFLAFATEYFARLRERESDDYEQYVRLRHESLRDVTHPWQAVARVVRRRSG